MSLPLVLDVAIKGSVLVGLAAAGTAVSRRTPAAQRHYVWTLALAGLLVLPLLSLLTPWQLPVLPITVTAAPATTPSAEVAPAAWDEIPSPTVERQALIEAARATDTRAWQARIDRELARASSTTQAPSPKADVAVAREVAPGAVPISEWSLLPVTVEAPVAFAEIAADAEVPAPAIAAAGLSIPGGAALALRVVRIAGLVFALARLIVGVLMLRWVLRGARAVSDRGWLELLASATERLDLRREVRLLESPHANMPMAFGLWRPVVILPMESDDWSDDLREVVLLHELAHVRRRDVLANLVGEIACALYWFNPLVWSAARRLRIEAERACDDLVLSAGAQASAYAGHLLAMVQSASSLRAPAFALPMAQPSAFEGRVLAILEPGLDRKSLTARAAALGVVALLAVALPLAALAPQQQDGRERQRERRRERHAMETRAAAERDVERELARHNEARLERIVQVDQRAMEERVAHEVAVNTHINTNVDAEIHAERAAMDAMRAHRQAPGGALVTAALLESLSDEHEPVRLAAIHALGDRADTAAINALLAALRRDTSKEVRKAAAQALGEIEDARAVQGLLAAMRDERDREVRLQIVWALGEIESADAVAGLGAALRGEDDPETRRMMIWALGEIESADAVPFLTPLLRDADQETREKVVWALGEIESAAAVDPLSAMLATERSSAVREQIVWALGEIEDARAVPALERALSDTSLAVRRKAVWALGEVDGLRTAPAGLIRALSDADSEVRAEAARAVGEIQDPAATPGLIALLRDSDMDVKRNAIQALSEIPGTAAIEALVAALRDSDPEIRRLAAQALGNR